MNKVYLGKDVEYMVQKLSHNIYKGNLIKILVMNKVYLGKDYSGN